MFSVSTLPLDDALKLAMPQTNGITGVINKMLQQFAPLSDISQGSVATHLRRAGIFSKFYCKFSPILTVK